jgi:phosphatidylglycerophosphatase A
MLSDGTRVLNPIARHTRRQKRYRHRIRSMNEAPTSAQKWLLRIGSLGPLGHAPASGTVAVAVVGVPLYLVMQALLPVWAYVAVTIAFALFSVWLHDVGDRLLGEKDSRKLVLDELAGFFVAMIGVPPTWPLVLGGFLLERVLDIVKVPPANWIERYWPGGWGVVGDDLVAGLYALIFLQAAIRWLPAWVGL